MEERDFRVQELAKEVKRIYSKKRKFVTGAPTYTPSPKWDKEWERTANIILLLKADPEEYIQRQFEMTKPYPMPNMLASSAAQKKYSDYSEVVEERILEHVQYQVSRVKDRLKTMPITMVLRDGSLQLDPILVYLMAYNSGDDEISEEDRAELMDEYRDEALEQILLCPVLERVYKDFIPDDMLEKVRGE